MIFDENKSCTGRIQCHTGRMLKFTVISLLLSGFFGNSHAATVYWLTGGGFTAPYYFFSLDADGQQPISTGDIALAEGGTYTFKISSAYASPESHPFYIGDQGGWRSGASFTITGDGSNTSGIASQGQSFTFTLPTDYLSSGKIIQYYCTAHTSMIGEFAVVPEPAAPLLATATCLIFALRRSRGR